MPFALGQRLFDSVTGAPTSTYGPLCKTFVIAPTGAHTEPIVYVQGVGCCLLPATTELRCLLRAKQ